MLCAKCVTFVCFCFGLNCFLCAKWLFSWIWSHLIPFARICYRFSELINTAEPVRCCDSCLPKLTGPFCTYLAIFEKFAFSKNLHFPKCRSLDPNLLHYEPAEVLQEREYQQKLKHFHSHFDCSHFDCWHVFNGEYENLFLCRVQDQKYKRDQGTLFSFPVIATTLSEFDGLIPDAVWATEAQLKYRFRTIRIFCKFF